VRVNGRIRGIKKEKKMRYFKTLDNIEKIVSKGQPFAKRNKDRKIRAELLALRRIENGLLFSDVWDLFKGWLFLRFKTVRRITG